MIATQENSLSYYIGWLLEILAYGAVNIFAMITGYLMINRKFRYSKILSIWAQVLFYSLVLTFIMWFATPQNVGLKLIIKSFFPATFQLYWYYTAYFAMFFFIPFLNRMFCALSKKEATALVVTIGVLFTVLGLLKDSFQVNAGYSLLWLCAMYLVGAYLHTYVPLDKIKKRYCILVYFVLALITLFARPVIRFVTTRILGKAFGTEILISYVSPTVVLMAIALVLFFLRLRFPKWLQKTVAFLAPLSFAVYIIHSHPAIWSYFIQNRFADLAQRNAAFMAFAVIVSTIVIYLICTVIELIRVYLFRFLQINRLLEKLGNKIDRHL